MHEVRETAAAALRRAGGESARGRPGPPGPRRTNRMPWEVLKAAAGIGALAAGTAMAATLVLTRDGPSVGLWLACWGAGIAYLAL